MKIFHFCQRRAALVCAFGTLACLASGAAQSDNWPVKPITLIVGYPAGGSTDLMARIIGPELSSQLGTPVVVENVGGAGGTIGAQKVVNSQPDGYTLLVGANNELAISALVNRAVKYTSASFTPIGLIASQPMVLVASQKAGVRTTADFLRKVKAHPGNYSYGSSGVGTALHVAGEMVKKEAGLFMTHIPYRGVAPLTSDLIGNNIEYGVFVLSSGLPHIRSGKVIALGVTTPQRSPLLPDVPALAETPALKDISIDSWFGLVGPARLPDAVTVKLKKALADTLQSPDIRKKLADSSSTPADPAQDFPKFWATEVSKYRKIVNFAKIAE